MIVYDFSVVVLRASTFNKSSKVGTLLDFTLDVLLLALLPEKFR